MPTNTLAQPDTEHILLQQLSRDQCFQVLCERVNDISPFNIFDVTGPAHMEVRHSKFLAFLLDPAQYHGLGNAFAMRLIQHVRPDHRWKLGQIIVDTNRHNTDILLRDEQDHIVIILENKVWSWEHDNQLQRYMQLVSNDYPGWEIMGLYLSPSGRRSSHAAYIPVSYKVVCEMLETILNDMASKIDINTRILMTHYVQVLRRDMVGTHPDTVKLCHELYAKHQQAIDLLIKHIPDRRQYLFELVKSLVKRHNKQLMLTFEAPDSGELCFVPTEWQDIPALQECNWGLPQLLVFEFDNYPEQHMLCLRLYLGPGPAKTHKKLLHMVETKQPLFRISHSPYYPDKWKVLYSQTFLEAPRYHNAVLSDVEAQIRERWQIFIRRDLPKIRRAVREQFNIEVTP